MIPGFPARAEFLQTYQIRLARAFFMNTEPFNGNKSVHSARRGVQRDVVHRANAST